MKYHIYRYRLDQLSDVLGIGRIEKISMLRRNHGVPSAPNEALCQAPRMKRSSIPQLKQAEPKEQRPFFLGASLPSVNLEPGEVLWDTGTQKKD